MPPLIDGFTDLVEVGRGGFGTVYRAHQLDPQRDVAVKVLPDVRADSDAYGRFTREFQALAAVGGHPNIARVHQWGVTADGSGFLALELLDGGSLADRVRAGRSPWADVASWGVQLAGALETAHRAGITHRDLKPENVLFDAAQAPKLVDFGIASVPGAFRTTTGAVTLTLAHAAPEVVAGGRGGVPGDVYSLASTLYAALAGGAAFVASADETLVPMLARIATAPVPDLRPLGVPAAVCAALERGMAKDPADRPSSAEALGMSLQAALAREGISAAAPPLLLSPGVAAAFVVSESAPVLGTAASTYDGGGYDGERTVTGWVAPSPEPAVAAVVDLESRRRRSPWWVAAAGVVAASLVLVSWRGIEAPTPAAAGPSTPTPVASSPSPASTSPSPSAAASVSPAPTKSASARASAVSTSRQSGGNVAFTTTSRAPRSTPTRSASTPSIAPNPDPTTSTSATPTPTPSPTPRPLAPRRVRVSGSVLAPAAVTVPRQVAVAVSWDAASSGTAASAYEIRWKVVGGPDRGTSTVSMSMASPTVLVVPVPAGGVRYEWAVRAVAGAATSGWAAARVVMPQLVGRRGAVARSSLRVFGILSSTYPLPAPTTKANGRVLAQSTPRGRVVSAGTSIALGVGKAP